MVSVHKPDTNKQYYGGFFFSYHFFFRVIWVLFFIHFQVVGSLSELQNHALGNCQMELNFGSLNRFTLS